MAPTLLQQAGARDTKENRFAPIYVARWFTGLWTQRNPLRDPSQITFERYYGGRPDALLTGQNIELTNRLTLARRPGSTAYSTANFPGAVTSFYPFKQFTANTENITLMVDTPTIIYSLTPTAKTTVFTKTVGASLAYFLGVGNTLYIGDSIDQKAWAGIGTPRNWGIAFGSSAGGSAYAGTGTDAGGTGQTWTNPTNFQGAPDAAYATASSVNSTTTNNLQATNYGFGVSGNIQGISVAITGHITDPAQTGILSVQLLSGGFLQGIVETGNLIGTGDTTVKFGSNSDLWGAMWTAAQINSSTFGVNVYGVGSGGQNQNGSQVNSATTLTDTGLNPDNGNGPTCPWSSGSLPAGSRVDNSQTSEANQDVTTNTANIAGFGFSIPAGATITGIQLVINRVASLADGVAGLCQDNSIQLLKGGIAQGSDESSSAAWPSSAADATYGGSSDLWGLAWTPADINSSGFGFSFSGVDGGLSVGRLTINSATITVYYTVPPSSLGFALDSCQVTIYATTAPTATPTGSGSFTATSGYTYVYAYGSGIL